MYIGAAIVMLMTTNTADMKTQVMGSCKVEAIRTYPRNTEADEVNIWRYALACMEAKGYRFSNSAICWEGSLYGEARCYD